MSNRLLTKIMVRFQKKVPLIFTITACVGVAAVGVTSALATEKAKNTYHELLKTDSEKKAIVKASKHFIVPALLTGLTIATIVELHILNGKEKAALLTSFIGMKEYAKAYQNKVAERYSPEEAEEIAKEVTHELQRNSHAFHWVDNPCPDQKLRWLEPITGQIFERYEREIIDAEYHYNRNVTQGHDPTLGLFLYFLGLDASDESFELGWDLWNQDFYWVDFNHRYDPERDLYIIDYMYEPTTDWEEK